MERKQRAASLSGVYLAVVAIAIALVNVIAWNLNKRIDVTKNERFTLSKGSANLVSKGLKETLSIKLYVTKGLPTLDLFVDDLTNLMGEYERASGGKLTYQVIEPKTDEQKEEAKKHCSSGGCQPLQMVPFGEGSEQADQATITQGYMGIVFEYGAEEDTIPVLSPENTQGLEFWITNKIRNLRDKVDDSYPKIGLVKKEGISINDENLVPSGRGPGPNMKGILSQHFPFYKFEDVDLEGGKKAIDEKLNGVLLMQADKDWTDAELARIDQFLMRGDKALLVMSGAVNIKAADASMKAELNLRNLDKLVSAYGVEMKNEAIFEWGQSVRLPVQDAGSGRQQWIVFPGVLTLTNTPEFDEKNQPIDSSFTGFFRMEQLGIGFPSPLVGHPEKQPQAKVRTVMRTTENASVDASSPVDFGMKIQWPQEGKGDRAQRDIAIEVSGVLKSAFADKKPEGFDGDLPAESKAPCRVLVIAAGQFLANPFARAGNPPPMPPQMAMMGPMGGDRNLQSIAQVYAQATYVTNAILAFKNLLDWISNDTDLIATSAKLTSDPQLTYGDVAKPKFAPTDDEKTIQKRNEEWREERRALQSQISLTLTLLPPVVFMAFGILRWRRREANRANIKLAS
ncbi:MAG: GldG family protein [Deltaproteobacteria bacterium]|nr:GldG family protein [Deltaproteobacteria bacterium]